MPCREYVLECIARYRFPTPFEILLQRTHALQLRLLQEVQHLLLEVAQFLPLLLSAHSTGSNRELVPFLPIERAAKATLFMILSVKASKSSSPSSSSPDGGKKQRIQTSEWGLLIRSILPWRCATSLDSTANHNSQYADTVGDFDPRQEHLLSP